MSAPPTNTGKARKATVVFSARERERQRAESLRRRAALARAESDTRSQPHETSVPARSLADSQPQLPPAEPGSFNWELAEASAAPQGPPRGVIVDGLLRRGDVVAISDRFVGLGPQVAVQLAAAAAVGAEFLGRNTVPTRALCLIRHITPEELGRYVSMLAPAPPNDLSYHALIETGPVPTPSDIAVLICSQEFGLVITDAPLWAPAPLRSAVRGTGCSVVLIDANADCGSYDAVWHIRPTDEGDDSACSFALIDVQSRLWASDNECPIVSVKVGPDGWAAPLEVRHSIFRNVAERGATSLLELLGEARRALTLAEVRAGLHAAGVDLSPHTARRRLNRLYGGGLVLIERSSNHVQQHLYRVAPSPLSRLAMVSHSSI